MENVICNFFFIFLLFRKKKMSVKVKKLIVKKIRSSKDLEGKILNNPEDFQIIRNKNVDCYYIDEKTGKEKCLFKFRKHAIPEEILKISANVVVNIGRDAKTSTRQKVAGTKERKMINSAIGGYYDKFSAKQYIALKAMGYKQGNFPICRETQLTGKEPEKWKNVVPLIVQIDQFYRQLFPFEHKKQYEQAHRTPYVVDDTAFSTVTINYNLQTGVHKDSGDFMEGFGNLIVFEDGNYKGGETAFPDFGVAVDVRTGDFLGMDVHQFHANLPIIPIQKDYIRTSVVCYLREDMLKCQKDKEIFPFKTILAGSQKLKKEKLKPKKKKHDLSKKKQKQKKMET